MPKKKGDFLCLISISCKGELQNQSCVCKKLPIFMVKGMPITGKILHTSKVLN